MDLSITVEHFQDGITTFLEDVWSATFIDEDLHPGITKMYRTIGWQWYLDQYGDKGRYIEYNEELDHTMKWCGVGVAYAMLKGFPHLHLDRKVAFYCMPSTRRLYYPKYWEKAGAEPFEHIDPKDMRRGDIVVVGTSKPFGTHITLCRYAPSRFRSTVAGLGKSYQTVECNGWGTLGNGRWGEGVVVRERRLSDVAKVYRPKSEHLIVGWF